MRKADLKSSGSGFKEALLFGVLGERQIVEFTENVDYIWPYVDGASDSFLCHWYLAILPII